MAANTETPTKPTKNFTDVKKVTYVHQTIDLALFQTVLPPGKYKLRSKITRVDFGIERKSSAFWVLV